MKHPRIVSSIIALTVFGLVAGMAWALGNFETSDIQQDQPMPKLELQEQIRNDAVGYIVSNHPETMQFSDNFTWTGGIVETFAPPETYIYNSHGWTVMIQYPLLDGQSYKVSIEYASLDIGVLYRMTWEGTWNIGNITETSFTFSQ